MKSLYMNLYRSTDGRFDPKCLQMTPVSSRTIVFARLSSHFQPNSLMHEADDEVVQE